MTSPHEYQSGADILAEDEIFAVLHCFDLTGPIRTRRFTRGSRRSPKAHLTCGDGRELLLKRRAPERSDPSRVAFAHAVQADLVAAGVPAVAPIAAVDGVTYIEQRGHIYELFPFVSGHRPDRSERTARSAGNMLAIIHQAVSPEDYPSAPVGPGYHRVRDVLRLERVLMNRLGTTPQRAQRTAELSRYLIRAYADSGRRARAAGYDTSPDAVLHGDWHPGNLLMEEDAIHGIIDFEAARVEPRVVDIANAALQFAHEPIRDPGDPSSWPTNLSVHRVRALIRGYDDLASDPLSSAERATIAWLMIEALIHEALLPVAATGRFADIDGLAFLDLIERRTRWLRPRAAKVMEGRE